jgi:hypothetical protein
MKLQHLQTTEVIRLEGYLEAAQHVFTKGDLDVSLEVALFEISDSNITDEEVIRAAYPNSNPIEHRAESSVQEMTARVHGLLSIAKGFWQSRRVAELLEEKLREGYWEHLKSCFDYTNARIVELGDDVPYVNIPHGEGFTFVCYAPDMSRCLLLVGNISD